MSNTNNVMNEGLPSNVICSDPYGCTFEEIVELLGEKSGRAFFRTLYKEKPKIQNQTIKVNSIENGGDTKKYAFELNDGYCIETVSIKQLLVRALLDYVSVFHNQYQIRVHNR